ncbi:MAG TPA: Hsp20/alpha crystallin family protein [Aquifex aeolicus]|uniref:Hsp20/alpha crystallin family protein n=1 Tax=Aquifex aeolicus TaxID=63363 RepID=A0A9D0YP25_AQUAO|nr:Hsp20/alpha crystallin family protein [Aquificales bacterium]HIP86655.1 Hsp20/alpha crystallin family protein [Aquifex sp.]HIP97847.1 Hsp20/alpha crystallin family protein [Aquifex aeolicus]HIQ26318.1 Hsp20/alpha crystallin family protein [Aquifex aeolicus]
MTLRRFNPLEELLRLQRELERLAQSAISPAGEMEKGLERGLKFIMPIEVYETPSELVIKVELPGVKKEDTEVVIRDNYLIVKVEKKEEAEENKEHVHIRERIYGKFERIIPLTTDVDTDNAKATFKDGVLEIRFPKKFATQEKKITIE